MTLDQYQACPCGRDKKIKFCCGKDIHSELDKIGRAVDGEQFESALQQLDRLIEEDIQRQCAWAVKCTVLLKTGRLDEAQTAVDQFLTVAPENPVGLAELAILKASKLGDLDRDDDDIESKANSILEDASATLHKALEFTSQQMSAQVFEAIGMIGQFLVESGHILAGREHLMFQYAISGEPTERGGQLLMQTSRSQEIPILLKQETSVPKPADWVNWKEDYVAIRDLALRGAWTQAADKIEALISANEPHIVLLRAHAALRCRLPNREKTANALRALAAAKEVSLDDAAEAEALAQLIDTSQKGEMTEMLRVEYPIENTDEVLEKLQSNRHAKVMAVDFNAMSSADQPPPKAGFTLLDREAPAPDAPLTIDTIPIVRCESLLYGKQTDRNARFEVITTRIKLQDIDDLIRGILGDSITGERSEEVLGETPLIGETMSILPQFPDHAPVEFRRQYLADRQKELILDRWPSTANPVLDNKTPNEVADDPDYQRRLLGTVMVLETAQRSDGSAEIFKSLRTQLKLPELPTLKITNADEAIRTPLIRLPRLDEKSLPDEAVATCFVRAAQNGIGSAVLQFGEELLTRDGLKSDIDPSEVYGRMSQYCTDTSKSIEYLQKAQEESTKAGKSPAVWMISEFAARMMQGQVHEAQNLLNRVQTHHLNEPGVPQLLMQTLQQFGIVGPDGRPAMPGAAPPTGAPAAATAPASASGGGLWTPDGGAPAAAPQGESKEGGKIWMPGMD